MATRYLTSRIDRFAGLSDRSVPVNLTRIECPDLLNADFSDRSLKRRNGYTRVHTNQLKDASARFDGYNDYAVIPYYDQYDKTNTGTAFFACSFDVVLQRNPIGAQNIIQRGTGSGSSLHLEIGYNDSGNWFCNVWDATAGALRQMTVSDANAVFNYRRVALYPPDGGGTTYTFEILDSAGATVGSTTATITTWVNPVNTSWFLGCKVTVADTAPAEGVLNYTAFHMAELRFTNDATAANLAIHRVVGRELQGDPSSSEEGYAVGYWKMNDGTGSTFADTASAGNDTRLGANGGVWVTDSVGAGFVTALKFFGERGHVWIDAANCASLTFSDASTGYRRWALGFVWTPLVDQGETTVRNQTLFWSGTNTTTPQPLGIRVVSDDLQLDYTDSGGAITPLTLGMTLFSHINKRIRILVKYDDLSGGETITFSAFVEGGTTASTASDATVAGNPGTISDNWALGRLVTSYDLPQTFNTKASFGVFSGFHVHKSYEQANGLAPAINPLTTPLLNYGRFTASQLPSTTLLCGVPLEDGSGHILETLGSTTTAAYLFPNDLDGVSWAEGLVTPDDAPEITLLTGFRRIGPMGDLNRSIVAISGTTLYDIDLDTGTPRAVNGSLYKGGKWTYAQYGSNLYLSCNNGRRPVVYDGIEVRNVGIEAPTSRPVGTPSTTGGSLADGAYYLYVTFRNSSTGVESNPSPVSSAVTVSGGGGSGSISSVAIPRSADLQVDQRRIWITALGGGVGSTAHLAATINDNILATYSTAIQTVDTTATTLTYTGNEEPPAGGIVAVWKDRLFVSGDMTQPTRVFYSSAGELESFNQTTGYEDADLDAGDPVVGIRQLRDQLVVYLRDGRVGLTATGSATAPFILTRINQDVGAVGHNAILVYENRHLFLGERDIWLWDGEGATNISSPTDPDRPSVKYFIRDTISDAYKSSNAHIGLHRSRDQVWLACTTGSNTRNDTVLVIDISQGIWSRYRMDMDVLEEVEDASDEPTLYGGSRGFIVKLDTSTLDGHATGATGTATGGSTTTLIDTGASWTVDAFKGLLAHIYDVTGDLLSEVRIARNTSNTLYFTSAASFTVAANDKYTIAYVPFYADFLADFGSPMSLKRVRWIKLAGKPAGSNVLRMSFEADQPGRTWNYSATEGHATWNATEIHKDILVGGLGRSFRFRIGETGYTSQATANPLPGATGSALEIYELQIEAEELQAR